MTPNDTKHLSNFLTTFDAIGLGEGDINAGINTLTAMAITLANIARPGSGIQTPSGKLIKVGSSLLISGSLSRSLINDEVITPLRTLQNNLSSQVFRALDELKQKAAKEGHESISLPDNARTYDCSNSVLGLFQTDIAPLGSEVDQWLRVLNATPTPRIQDLATHPKLVVSASKAADLKKQLVGLNLRHPLVIFGLSKSATHESTSDLLTALMEGYLPDNIGGHTIKGNLIITDPGDIIRDLAKAANQHTAYLGRLLWLVDSCAGPEARMDEVDPNQACIEKISMRFQHALALAFSKRLNNHSLGPVIHKFDMTQAQVQWVAFLQSMEKHLPGISGTARKLLVTLTFGIIEFTSATEWPADCKYTLSGIESFARLLVHRMANVRNSTVYSAMITREARQKKTILLRLAEGPHTVREITRRFDKLKTEPCREMLYDLEAMGKVKCVNDEWHIKEPIENLASQSTLEA